MLMNTRLLSTVVAAVTLASFAVARAEENAFLDAPARTHAQLMNQVRSNDKVMSRFMRHFGMTRNEVIQYFTTLRLSTLQEDTVFTVYNVPEGTETIRARTLMYKKGTKVWVDANGTPILKESCGNPLLRGTDEQTSVLNPQAEGDPIANARPSAVPSTSPSDASSGIIASNVESSALLYPPAPPQDISGIILGGGSNFNPGFLLPLIAVPFVLDGGEGEPIPEPGTMIGLAVGAGLLAARKRRKSKQA